MKHPSLAVVIPTLNEAAQITTVLQNVRATLPEAHIVVVDGGSNDGTVDLAMPLAHQVLLAPAGRARQMNAGCAAITAAPDYWLFLHADTELPANANTALGQAFEKGAVWGRFDVRITGQSRLLPMVAWFMNWRSRLTGIATGDQAIFVRHDAFTELGGFADQPLMEDIELSRQLRQLARPVCLSERVMTSGRRWESRGLWRTIFLMWRLRYRYWRGHSAEELARLYR